MSRTVQIGLGALAVAVAAALSRRGSSGSLGALSQKKCGWYPLSFGASAPYADHVRFPAVAYGTQAEEKVIAKRISEKTWKRNQCQDECFARFPGELQFSITEERSKCLDECNDRFFNGAGDQARRNSISQKWDRSEYGLMDLVDAARYRIEERLHPLRERILDKLRALVRDETMYSDQAVALIRVLDERGYQPTDRSLLPLGPIKVAHFWDDGRDALEILENDLSAESEYAELATKFLHVHAAMESAKGLVDLAYKMKGSMDPPSKETIELVDEVMVSVGITLCELEDRLVAIKKSCDESDCESPVAWREIPLREDTKPMKPRRYSRRL